MIDEKDDSTGDAQRAHRRQALIIPRTPECVMTLRETARFAVTEAATVSVTARLFYGHQ
ncbi:hypothetical protein [Pseudomonas sp. GM21]|uniref:hypothetical protein n=1 Tax=Pseudomonas sp. GM21 TaxID=1144325 RepID=UPI0012F9ED94|nr:hypothetical protein [Pseudomonas sp. GM21]